MNLRQGCIIKLWKRNNLLVKLCSENVRNGAPASSHEVCDMKGEEAYRSSSILSVLTLWVVATSFPPVRSISCIPVSHKVRVDLKAEHKRLTSITDNCTFNHWMIHSPMWFCTCRPGRDWIRQVRKLPGSMFMYPIDEAISLSTHIFRSHWKVVTGK